METGNQKFEIETETGEIKEAELLTIVDIDNKKYAVYMIDAEENGNKSVDVLASYVIKDNEGFDELVDIDNNEDKEKISQYIRNLIA